MYRAILVALLFGAIIVCARGDDYREAKVQMLDAIRDTVVLTAGYMGKRSVSDAVMQQMGRVPRHEFVIPQQRHNAYLNGALPHTHKQTISQPLIVALMTDFLEPKVGDAILEKVRSIKAVLINPSPEVLRLIRKLLPGSVLEYQPIPMPLPVLQSRRPVERLLKVTRYVTVSHWRGDCF